MTYPYYTRDAQALRTEASAKNDPDDPAGYVPDSKLVDAVNVALLLERPLLITGAPGTGKTQLARSVAWQLKQRKLLNVGSDEVEKFETKSTSLAKDLFYTFDTLRRFHAVQVKGSERNVDYVTYNALGRAILNALTAEGIADAVPKGFEHRGQTRSVVLIDEVDKAPRDFPNDLLNEIDHMYFKVPELDNRQIGGAELTAGFKPIVIITSNSERNLPDPFLRRCIYFDIPFPEKDELERILRSRLPTLTATAGAMLSEALEFFLKLRGQELTQRKISPAELIQWITYMLKRGADPAANLRSVKAIALEGLSAMTKDPADQPRVAKELSSFVGT